MEIAQVLARFVTHTDFDALPVAVIKKAKELILDQLGCQIAASSLPWSKAVYEYVKDNKGLIEESTIINYGLKTTAQDSAFVNACFGHGFLADDTHLRTAAHLGCMIVPSAMAVGEKECASGKQFLTAVVLGYEVASRIGIAAPLIGKRGFQTGPVIGPFGVTAAASSLFKFNEDQTQNALSISGSQSSGLMEYAMSGGSVNRLHGGMAAYGGIRATQLVKRRFTGPPTVFEGSRGFLHAFSGESFPERITDKLGLDYNMLDIGLKAYCCCGTQAGGLDAISNLIAKYEIKPPDIEEILVSCVPTVFNAGSKIKEPEDITSAQFSGRFGIAVRLIKGGNGFKEYVEQNLRDPEILNLVAKINYELDEDLEKIPNSHLPTKITVRMKNGNVYSETTVIDRGTAMNPLTECEVNAKFSQFASMLLPVDRIKLIMERVSGLESISDIHELTKLLVIA
jgi:2-methylcitrate dehydratase PrpD